MYYVIESCLLSSAASTSRSWLGSLAYFDLASIIHALAAHASRLVRLIHRVLLVSYSDSTLIIAKIVDTPVDIIVNHLTCLQECLLYIEGGFGGGLQEYESILLGEPFSFLRANLSATVQIGLVSDQHDHDIRIAVLSHLF